MPRIRRTLGIKSRKFDEQTFENDFRYPPKPDSYYDVKEKGMCRWCDNVINDDRGITVSYTHLTLPTKRIV